MVGLPERVARPLIAIQDEEIKEKAIIKCMERLNGEIGAGMAALHYTKLAGCIALSITPRIHNCENQSERYYTDNLPLSQ